MEIIENDFKEAMKYFGLYFDHVTNKSLDTEERLNVIRSTMNSRMKDVQTFEDLQSYIRHVRGLGQYQIYKKGTEFIASEFKQEEDTAKDQVQFRYQDGALVYPIQRLHEIIEIR